MKWQVSTIVRYRLVRASIERTQTTQAESSEHASHTQKRKKEKTHPIPLTQQLIARKHVRLSATYELDGNNVRYMRPAMNKCKVITYLPSTPKTSSKDRETGAQAEIQQRPATLGTISPTVRKNRRGPTPRPRRSLPCRPRRTLPTPQPGPAAPPTLYPRETLLISALAPQGSAVHREEGRRQQYARMSPGAADAAEQWSITS